MLIFQKLSVKRSWQKLGVNPSLWLIGYNIAQSAVYEFKFSSTHKQKDQEPEGQHDLKEEIKPLINKGKLGHLKNTVL